MLQKCPLADMGCITQTLMNATELEKHLQIMHLHHHDILLLQPEQISLLHSALQPFIALMPSASPPPLSTSAECNRCDSGLGTDESGDEDDLHQDDPPQLIGITMQQLLQQESGEFEREPRDRLPSLRDEQITSPRTQVTNLETWVPRIIRTRVVDCPDFRLACSKSATNDGCLIWKIARYCEHKAAATNTSSLPFYSGRYGYKMCLRLYIMGDGIGKGTHLSLFFVVMHGEFDNILQWPFTHKVTFKLINQAGGRDIVDTFQPHFVKPTSELDMNSVYGCPCFISHSELEQGGFIVDDTMFIKCGVDTSTIQHP